MSQGEEGWFEREGKWVEWDSGEKQRVKIDCERERERRGCWRENKL